MGDHVTAVVDQLYVHKSNVHIVVVNLRRPQIEQLLNLSLQKIPINYGSISHTILCREDAHIRYNEQ